MKSIKIKPINSTVLDLYKTNIHHTTSNPIYLQQTTPTSTKQKTNTLINMSSIFFAFNGLILLSLGLHPNDVFGTSFYPIIVLSWVVHI